MKEANPALLLQLALVVLAAVAVQSQDGEGYKRKIGAKDPMKAAVATATDDEVELPLIDKLTFEAVLMGSENDAQVMHASKRWRREVAEKGYDLWFKEREDLREKGQGDPIYNRMRQRHDDDTQARLAVMKEKMEKFEEEYMARKEREAMAPQKVLSDGAAGVTMEL